MMTSKEINQLVEQRLKEYLQDTIKANSPGWATDIKNYLLSNFPNRKAEIDSFDFNVNWESDMPLLGKTSRTWFGLGSNKVTANLSGAMSDDRGIFPGLSPNIEKGEFSPENSEIIRVALIRARIIIAHEIIAHAVPGLSVFRDTGNSEADESAMISNLKNSYAAQVFASKIWSDIPQPSKGLSYTSTNFGTFTITPQQGMGRYESMQRWYNGNDKPYNYQE